MPNSAGANPGFADAPAFHERLKFSTAAAHETLELLPISKELVSPALNRKTYTLYLQLMYEVLEYTERIYFPLLKGVISDIDERKKISSIRKDLKYIGAATNQSETLSLFTAEGNNSVPFALGVVYVTEGSTLGGRYILRNVHAALGLNGEGATYFEGYGRETGMYWKKFLQELTSYENKHQCGDEIINGANFAFEMIRQHFIRRTNNS